MSDISTIIEIFVSARDLIESDTFGFWQIEKNMGSFRNVNLDKLASGLSQGLNPPTSGVRRFGDFPIILHR